MNWKNKFECVILDGMHLIMRLAREVNAEHPRRSKLLRDLASAIYEKCPDDMAKLKAARDKAGLPPDGTLGKDRYRFVKTLIPGGEHTANRVKAVIWSHMKMDTEAKKDIPRDTPLSPADIGYPLISKKCRQVLKNQLVHIRNGCISDDPNKLPYKAVKEVNYPNTGIMLVEVKSL